MNPDFPQNEREQLEAKLTTLLLGELSAEESAALHKAMEQDRELAALYEQLKLTIEFVREGALEPVAETATPSAPLKLSREKREKLLAQFKTIAPKEFARPRRVMDWLVPLAAAAVILIFFGYALVPNFIRTRETAQKNTVINNLRLLDGAKQQWALENNKPADAEPTLDDLKSYLGRDGVTALPSIGGEMYVPGKVSELPKVEASAAEAKKLFGAQALAGAETRDGKVLLSPLAAMSVDSVSVWGHSPEQKASAGQDAAKVPPLTVPPPDVGKLSADRTVVFLPSSAQALRSSTLSNYMDTSVQWNLGTGNANLPYIFGGARGNSRADGFLLPVIDNSQLSLDDDNKSTGNMRVYYAASAKDEQLIGPVVTAPKASPPDVALSARFFELNSNENHALGFAWYAGNESATNQMAANAESVRGNSPQADELAVIRSLRDENIQTSQIIQDGKLMFQLGKLDGAEAKMNEALSRAPSNQVALYYLSLAKQARSQQVVDARNLTSMRRMMDVDKGWADSENAAKTAPYFAAKEDLENAKRWRQILAMKAGQEEVDKDLPKVSIVQIFEPASVTQAEKPSLGDKFKETFSGKVERTARITVEQPRPDIIVFGGASVSQAYDPYFLLTEFETIQSHAVLGKVVSALKLNEEWGKKYNRGQPMNEADTEALLKKSLELSTEKNTKLIDIGVKSEKPEDAARIANAVAEAYRQYRAENYEELKNRGVASLQTQLAEQDQKVKLAQANVDELAKKLNGFDPTTGMPVAGVDTKSTGTSHTSTFKVNPNTFYASLKISDASPTTVPSAPVLPGHTNRGFRYMTGLDSTADIQSAVIQFFRAKGVDLTAPNAVFFNDRQGTLTVHAATADLDKVTAIMDAFNAQVDAALPKPSVPPPTPQPEILVRENAFSTFSLNVSDVSFKLAAASLEKGQMPEPASIRSEEFINAFDYRDPEAAPGVPIAFASERARYPFAHNRDLLRFSIKTAAAGRQAGRPLNIVLLLDNSGSMERADRVGIIQEALRVLAGQLQASDTFSIVTFARTAQLRVDGVPGNQAAAAAKEIAKLTPEGGTNLGEALDLAYETALHHYLAKGDNRVVLLTDGAANLGEVKAETLKQKVEAHRKQGVALDCFGIGWEGYNDDLLEVLTRNGDGRYGFINTPEGASTEFVSQIAGALHVAAADVKVQVEFNPKRVTSYRQIGYAKHQLTKEQFRDNTVDAAEIAAQEAGNALYTIETNPQGEGAIATVRVRYKVPATGEIREQAWEVPYTGGAIALEQASPAMRLAATVSAFSEWLATSPFAAEVSTSQLLNYLSGVPQVYGVDVRPKKLEWMIRQAGSISGK